MGYHILYELMISETGIKHHLTILEFMIDLSWKIYMLSLKVFHYGNLEFDFYFCYLTVI